MAFALFAPTLGAAFPEIPREPARAGPPAEARDQAQPRKDKDHEAADTPDLPDPWERDGGPQRKPFCFSVWSPRAVGEPPAGAARDERPQRASSNTPETSTRTVNSPLETGTPWATPLAIAIAIGRTG